MKTSVLSIGLLCMALEMAFASPTSLEAWQKAPGAGDVNAQVSTLMLTKTQTSYS